MDGVSDPYMSGLYDRFNKIAVNIQEIHGKIDATNPSTIFEALEEIKTVISNLLELQNYQKNLPDTQGAEMSISIGREVDELLEQTKQLYSQLDTIANRLTEVGVAASGPSNSGSTGSNSSNIENSDGPDLSRDDLGKLLLLTSKAYAIKVISVEQRNKIKDEIILQKGYLRNMFLAETDISQALDLMGAFPV